MSLFVIGDLHLALSDKSKPMDIFKGWENYMQLLEENWEKNISPEGFDLISDYFRILHYKTKFLIDL